MRYAVSQLISKVGSLLQLNSSENTIYLPPELSTINQMIINYNNTNTTSNDRNDI